MENHGEDERTWEPLEQLMQDVPDMVVKYVDNVDDIDLRNTYQYVECEVANNALIRMQNEAKAADDTNDRLTARGRRADKVAQRVGNTVTAAKTSGTQSTQEANATRDAHTAAHRRIFEKN